MSETTKTWGIRDVPEDIKSVAGREASKAGLKVGEWLALAIREKVKNDRKAGRAVAVKQASNPVDISQASSVIEMLERLKNIGSEPSESLKKQAQSLVRQAMRDVKHGRAIVKQEPEPVKQVSHIQGTEADETGQ